MCRLFEGGHYNAQPWDCAAPIRGWLLNGVRRLFEEIRYFGFEEDVSSEQCVFFPPIFSALCIYVYVH